MEGTCLRADECISLGELTRDWSDGEKLCVHLYECQNWARLAYEGKCVDTCPDGTFISEDQSSCISACESGLFEELTRFETPQRRCVATCTYRLEVQEAEIRCYADGCPENFYHEPSAPADQPNCIAQCKPTEYLHEAKECLTKAECNAQRAFVQDSQCVAAVDCGSGTFAYEATGNCEEHTPAPDGDFDPALRGKGVYACATGAVLDVREETWKCVSRLTCIQSDGILTDEETCIDRAGWLEKEQNFVDITFHAATYSGSGEMSAENVCAVPGAEFVAERTCGCGNAYLDVTGGSPVCTVSPAFDANHLDFSFAYEANGQEVEAHVIIGS